MAQGEIIETERNHSLGRLLIDQDLSIKLYDENPEFHSMINQMFQPFENPLDYLVYDEFKWYLAENFKNIPDHGLRTCSAETRLGFTKHRLKLVNHILFNPKFAWNARNSHGKIHLQATNNFLSRNGLNGVSHEFERRGFSGHRTLGMLNAADTLIDQNPSYLVLQQKI